MPDVFLGVYLSVTLLYAAVSIILTVLTLRLQVMPEGSEVPMWLQKFTQHVLTKCTCAGSHSSVTQIKTITNDEKKETNLKKAKKAALMRKSKKANAVWDEADNAKDTESCNEEAETFPYQNKDVAEMLDRFFFWVFTILETLTTVIFMTTLTVGSVLSS